jgi:hypothetical protein
MNIICRAFVLCKAEKECGPHVNLQLLRLWVDLREPVQSSNVSGVLCEKLRVLVLQGKREGEYEAENQFCGR